ncbi:MAG: S8 family serine peptidase [Eggerthellaceae bacterium]|nr:S8 family serine peptidase [Eggerthellaceae bacterium]
MSVFTQGKCSKHGWSSSCTGMRKTTRNVVSCALSFILVVGLAPAIAPVQQAQADQVSNQSTNLGASSSTSANDGSASTADAAGQTSSSQSNDSEDSAAQIAQLLAAGRYTDGQVIAAVRSDAAATEDWFADRSNAQTTDQSDEQAIDQSSIQATDQSGSQASSQTSTSSDETLAQTDAQSYVSATQKTVTDPSLQDDNAISIILIESPTLSTEEMLRELWNDDRVLSVEPNYLMTRDVDTVQSADATARSIAEYTAERTAAQTGSIAQNAVGVQDSGQSPDQDSNQSSDANVDQGLADASDQTTSNQAAQGDGQEVDSAQSVSGDQNTSNGQSAESQSATTGGTSVNAQSISTQSISSAQVQSSTSQLPVLNRSAVLSSAASVADPSNIADLTSYQWAFNNDGSTWNNGLAYLGFDINSPNWNTDTVNASGVVATVDSGIDVNHPDLKNVLVDNMQTYNADGGAHGINLSGDGDAADLTDVEGHGTHVAGIIASQWNDFGTSGVANGTKLVAVKAGNSTGELSVADMARAYAYLSKAVDNGLNLVAINNSWGDRQVSKLASVFVTALGKKGVITVFASGNAKIDSDVNPTFPSSLKGNPYALVVDGSNAEGNNVFNYGYSTTNVIAPGVNILSTGSQDMAGYNMYLAEADKNAVCKDTFDSAQGSVTAYGAYDDATRVASSPITRSIVSNYYYDNGKSMSISSDQMGDLGELYGGERYGFYLKIPVGSNTISCLDFKTFFEATSSSTIISALPYVAAESSDSSQNSGSIDWVAPTTGTLQMMLWMAQSSSRWKDSEMDLTGSLPSGEQYVVDDQGCITVKVMLMGSFATKADIPTTHLDCLAVGSTTTPYLYLMGTSMAAPMVTGAAAVAAKDQGIGDTQPAQSERDELAKERVSWIKSHVNQYDGRFKSICSSGGQIDLTTSSQAAIPVISSTQLATNEDPAQLTINGSYFGQGGASADVVDIAGKQAQVVSWADDKIVVTVPQDVTAGVVPVSVTTAAGTCTDAFLLEVPSANNVPVFEKEITVPQDFSLTSMDNFIVGMGNKLYVMPQDQYRAAYQSDPTRTTSLHGSYQGMWCYDEATEQWERCADLPARLDTLSATVHQGALIVCGLVYDVAAKTASPKIYEYDSANNTWQSLDASQVPCAASIVDADGQLLLVGGSSGITTTPSSSDLPVMEQDNIKTYDSATGAVAAVGTLATPMLAPKVTYTGNELYVAQGLRISSQEYSLIAGMQAMTKTDSGWTGKDISAQLPLLHAVPEIPTNILRGNYGMAATDDGLMISGALAWSDDSYTSLMDADTFILPGAATSTDASFVNFGKRAYRAPLYYATSATTDTWFYTMGSTVYNENGVILRATKIKNTNDGGNGATANADQDNSAQAASADQPTSTQGTTPATGDTLPVVPLLLVVCASGVIVVVARRHLWSN